LVKPVKESLEKDSKIQEIEKAGVGAYTGSSGWVPSGTARYPGWFAD